NLVERSYHQFVLADRECSHSCKRPIIRLVTSAGYHARTMAIRRAGGLGWAGVAAAVAVCALVAPTPARQQVFRSTADVVTLPVTVTARGDTLVSGLTRDQFTV